MALKKTAAGKYQILTYDPATGKKRYVGTRARKADARALDAEKHAEFRNAHKGIQRDKRPRTVREYAGEWLEHHHGENTRRPAPTTRQVNRDNLTRFLEAFGDRHLDGGITRSEALRWARQNGHRAKTVSAMFNDAIDEEATTGNPFANRRLPQSEGRKHIRPLTETEVDRLANIALTHWGEDGYGRVASALILFSAWVGTRPGETLSREWQHVNPHDRLVTVTRVKGRKQTENIVLPSRALDALHGMPHRTGLLFPTLTGKPMIKGSLSYVWNPVRAAFRQTLTDDRLAELLGGQDDLDLYLCRHHCASQIAAAGGNEYDVAAQLGNSPEICRDRYIHGYKEKERDRLRRFLDAPAVTPLRAVRGESA